MKKLAFPLSLTLLVLTISTSLFVHQLSSPGQAAVGPVSVPFERLESAATQKTAPERSLYDEGAGVTGIVRVEVIVGESGYPSEVKAVDGPEALRDEAETAAWQWRFDTKRLSGKPGQVKGELLFEFSSHQ